MKSTTKIVISVIILIFLTAGFYYASRTITNVTGKGILGGIIKEDESDIDRFAKCLKEKGVMVFVNEDCPVWIKQKEIFGSSVQYLDIVRCEEYGATCIEYEIKEDEFSIPTWRINNKNYLGFQTLEDLSELSGCQLQ